MIVRRIALVAIPMVVASAIPLNATPSEFSARILFNGLGVPGAVISATHASTDPPIVATTATDGAFRLANLDDGAWTMRVEMTGFVAQSHNVTLPYVGPTPEWTLAARSVNELATDRANVTAPVPPPLPPAQTRDT